MLNPPPSGAVELQGLDPDTVIEIGEVACRNATGARF